MIVLRWNTFDIVIEAIFLKEIYRIMRQGLQGMKLR